MGLYKDIIIYIPLSMINCLKTKTKNSMFGVYHMCRNKMYDNSTKAGREEKHTVERCLHYTCNIISSEGRLWYVKDVNHKFYSNQQ